MEDFTISGAWRHGYRFISVGTGVQFLILVLIGILAPIGVQYLMLGTALDATASPMTSGPAMMQAVGAPIVLLAYAVSHALQIGSYFAALRFGYAGGEAPAGAVVFGLFAGVVATLVVIAGYLVAVFGAYAIASPGAFELAVLVLTLPLIVVYSLFFISQAIMGAATLVLILAYAFIVGVVSGYPGAVAYAFGGSGLMVVFMLVLSFLLFWLSARFSCVTAVMAERGSLNIFSAIGESWRMTSDEQWPITRYVALVGFIVAAIIIGVSLVIGASTGGLRSGGLGMDTTGELILRCLFGVPLAFLAVMLPAGIYRQLTGEDTPAEIFE